MGWEADVEKWKQREERMREEDAVAKDKGELVGRYISEHVADGYAYYVVAKVDGNTVTLDHVDTFDGYAILAVEAMNRRVPLTMVKAYISVREKWENLLDAVATGVA